MTASDALVESLTMSRRLALSYAPAQTKKPILALLALDSRLAQIVRSSREPMLAQLRLAWWREQLGSDGSSWPKGEPLLNALRSWRGRHGELIALVDAWEGMAGNAPLDPGVFVTLAEARAHGFAMLAQNDAAVGPARRLGRNWALVDIAARLSHPQERAAVLELARKQDWRAQRLPRELRPLAVLHAIAARALRRDGNIDRIAPSGLLAALRTGLIGR